MILQAPPFLPDELAEWIGALVAFIGLGALLVKAGRDRQKIEDEVAEARKDLAKAIAALNNEMDQRFKDQGERIGSAAAACTGHDADIEGLKRTDLQHGLMIDTNSREVSRCAANGDKLVVQFDRFEAEANEFRGGMRERVARVEERLNMKDG